MANSTDQTSWAEIVSAISAAATALLTLAVVIAAFCAWKTARATLKAAKESSDQAKLDSIAQTRPYIFVEILPGLTGQAAYDVRIANVGRTSARVVTVAFDSWPDPLDDVATALRDLFETSRTLPPGSRIRSIWRIEGNFTDGSTEAGMPVGVGSATVTYGSDDPSHPTYTDVYELRTDKSGLWPVSEDGPTPDGVSGSSRKFYLLGQALVRRVGELGR